MEQRRLRLGDILDDYCPRERRVTNHAVVAMIEEDIKQTRCTTCDAEHAYKGARVPRRRKKESSSALYKEVLAGMPDVDVPALAPAPAPVVPFALVQPPATEFVQPPTTEEEAVEDATPMQNDDAGSRDDFEPEARPEDDAPAIDGPVHRPLIRATLPRPEGQKDARPLPDFTVRQAPARGNQYGGNFRGERMRVRAGGNGAGHGGQNGNRAQGGGGRFHGNRSSGTGRPSGRPGGAPGFRGGNSGPSGKRGRGPR
jgi:hypothetical protein